jgi:putative ABC transport system permease protein
VSTLIFVEVGDVRRRGLDVPMTPQIYILYAGGFVPSNNMAVLLRTETPPSDLASPVRGVVASMDPEVAVYDLRSLRDRLETAVSEPRFRALILGAFGLAALSLTLVGVHGVVAYAVAQRTQEVGIRMSLGADQGRIMREVLIRGAALTGVGLGLGLFGAYAASKVLERYLYDLDAHQLATFSLAVAALAGGSLLACCIPARRAARVDPMAALRAE